MDVCSHVSDITRMISEYQRHTMVSFSKEVNWRLAHGKRPLKTNGRLAKRQLTSSVKEATVSSPVMNLTAHIVLQ